MSVDLTGKVAIVTGAGNGLGRVYALLLAKLGAKVIVNDLGVGVKGGDGEASGRPADEVVNEIRRAGGTAVANYDSVVEGAKLVKTAIDNFGAIHIIVNNAGILRDVGFHRMTKKDFDLVHLVHVHGSKNVLQAAWPHFREQRYGRVVMITSSNGLYGQRGQANYSSAKAAVIGLGKALAIEGAKRNIKVNVVAPGAGSRMTKTIMPEALTNAWKPEYVAPLVAFLCGDKVPCTGAVFEAGGGWFAEVKFQRSKGAYLDLDRPMGVDDIAARWADITDFNGATDPEEDRRQGHNPMMQQILAKAKL